MIQVGLWNSGSTLPTDNASEAYTNSQSTSVERNVGLLAAYEYLYASLPACYNTTGDNYNNGCYEDDWLAPSLYYGEWTISPAQFDNPYAPQNYVISIRSVGNINGTPPTVPNSYPVYIRPVVYLKSEVTITGGTGESNGNEYILGYNGS